MLPQKAFYLIRHGQSEANAAGLTAGGQYDSPLNEIGLSQAHALAEIIDQLELKPDVIYHSYMKRAVKTAEIINGTLGLEMNDLYAHDLRERDCGEWDGLLWADIEPLAHTGEVPPGGESDPEFMQRIQSTFTDILNRENDRLPMIVSHGGHFHAMGLIYEYGMSHITNCHLHYFEPYPSFNSFPWRVWMFDIEGPFLVKRAAPFCLSHTLDQIAS